MKYKEFDPGPMLIFGIQKTALSARQNKKEKKVK